MASISKCFEDGQESGALNIVHKGLKELPDCADDYDLVDVLHVDISWNRFCEIPDEILSFAMMETLNCSRNFLKTLPDMSNLNSLTCIDLSQNQLHTLPVHLCQLPLKILKASRNHITTIPSEIGALSRLQFLDLSCNELINLPSTIGDLSAMRSLNIRRNHIITLPDELSKLKNLQKLDFSCNKISVIPPAFRLIQSLVKLHLKNNPLSSPPAHICVKGRNHLMKYLGVAAQQDEKRWAIATDNLLNRSPSSNSVSSNSRNENMDEQELHKNLSESLDQLHNNNIIKESLEECSDDSLNDSQAITNVNGTSDHIEDVQENLEVSKEEKPNTPSPCRPNSLMSSTHDMIEKQRLLQEKAKLTPQPLKTSSSTPPSRTWSQSEYPEPGNNKSLDRTVFRNIGSQNKVVDWEHSSYTYEKKPEEGNVDDLAARKEQLMKNKEEILESKLRLESIKSKSLPAPHDFDGIGKRTHISKQRSNKKFLEGVSNFTMRRFYDSAKEEFEELEKLRHAIEERLRIKLPDDLPASLSDGIVLCHLVNHLRKGTIAAIHVPSSGVPKLTMPKCQMNIDAFLDACRKVGVDKLDLCSPPDILEEKSPINLCKTVHALLMAMGVSVPNSTVINPLTPSPL